MARQCVDICAKLERRVDLLAIIGAVEEGLYGNPVIRCITGAKHKKKRLLNFKRVLGHIDGRRVDQSERVRP